MTAVLCWCCCCCPETCVLSQLVFSPALAASPRSTRRDSAVGVGINVRLIAAGAQLPPRLCAPLGSSRPWQVLVPQEPPVSLWIWHRDVRNVPDGFQGHAGRAWSSLAGGWGPTHGRGWHWAVSEVPSHPHHARVLPERQVKKAFLFPPALGHCNTGLVSRTLLPGSLKSSWSFS